MCDYHDLESSMVAHFASEEIRYNFSEQKMFITWRKLWTYLAKAQSMLGLSITPEQIAEMEDHIDDVRLDIEDKTVRRDIMVHVKMFANQCPKAASIIHIGVSDCYIKDNTDLIVLRDGFDIILPKLAKVIKHLAKFAEDHRFIPILGFIHLNPPHLTTLGKRATLWLDDFVMDERMIRRARAELRFRGVKGITGNQTSFLDLFNGDSERVRQLDYFVTKMAGFDKSFTVTGQVYNRKVDIECLSPFSALGATIHKFCNDIMIMKNSAEVASYASALTNWNPINITRCYGISRHLMGLVESCLRISAGHSLDRTPDDYSKVRRVNIAEAYSMTDVALSTLIEIIDELICNHEEISYNIAVKLPFISSEKLIMAMVQAGVDEDNIKICRERIGFLSKEASGNIQQNRDINYFIKLIRQDECFKPIHDRLETLLDPFSFVGRAPEQVIEFLNEDIVPLLNYYEDQEIQLVSLRI